MDMDNCVVITGWGIRGLNDNGKNAIKIKLNKGFLKHATLDYSVGGTNLFSLRLSNNKMTTANTIHDNRHPM